MQLQHDGVRRFFRCAARTSTAWGLALIATPAPAGGLSLYEVGTSDVALASAGYGARAQDASTVLTNPAGMTRLQGSQVTVGVQALYYDATFSIGAGTSPQLGGGDGGNPVGWFPGGSAFITHQVNPDLTLGFGMAGNFGLALQYDDGWVGRYYAQKSTLIGASLLPSAAYKFTDKFSAGVSLVAMYGVMKNTVAINNAGFAPNPDGQLQLNSNKWGWGANVGFMYEPDAGSRYGLVYNSQVKLDFDAQAQFAGLHPGLRALLAARGLLGANIGMGVTVPQGVMASSYNELTDRFALLASFGWQQWSKFGKVDVSVDSTNPVGLTTNLDFKDTWHGAVGGQYRMSGPWKLNFGVAYDSAFQDSSRVSPSLPSNSAWRFGLGAQNDVSKSFNWAVSAEYIYGGTLDVFKQSALPPVLGGRGNLAGAYDNTGVFFLAATLNWKF